MDVAAPHRAVVSGLDGDVLVMLAGRNAPMSGRQVADASKEGGFLGFGAEQVSKGEQAMLDQVRAAVSRA